MVTVTFEDLKDRHDECIFFLDELLKELDVLRVTEIILSKAIDVVHQLMLPDRQGALGSFMVVDLLLSQTNQFET